MKVLRDYMRAFNIVVLTAAMFGLAFFTDTAPWRELVGIGGAFSLLAAIIIEG